MDCTANLASALCSGAPCYHNELPDLGFTCLCPMPPAGYSNANATVDLSAADLHHFGGCDEYRKSVEDNCAVNAQDSVYEYTPAFVEWAFAAIDAMAFAPRETGDGPFCRSWFTTMPT